jgi:hypothetical protein
MRPPGTWPRRLQLRAAGFVSRSIEIQQGVEKRLMRRFGSAIVFRYHAKCNQKRLY